MRRPDSGTTTAGGSTRHGNRTGRMRILILGGDGYLGWPPAMPSSSPGHEVHVVDNSLRRRAHSEAGTDSLTPIGASLPARAEAWREVSSRTIGVTEGD